MVIPLSEPANNIILMMREQQARDGLQTKYVFANYPSRFTTNARIGEPPSHVRVSAVRFSPSARTTWHSHAVGQTLYVTDGRGLVQSRGGLRLTLRFTGGWRASGVRQIAQRLTYIAYSNIAENRVVGK